MMFKPVTDFKRLELIKLYVSRRTEKMYDSINECHDIEVKLGDIAAMEMIMDILDEYSEIKGAENDAKFNAERNGDEVH